MNSDNPSSSTDHHLNPVSVLTTPLSEISHQTDSKVSIHPLHHLDSNLKVSQPGETNPHPHLSSQPIEIDPPSNAQNLRKSTRRKSTIAPTQLQTQSTISVPDQTFVHEQASNKVEQTAMSAESSDQATNEQPGYKVEKSTNRRGPHYITCLRTDANASKLREDGPTTDSTGATCYWRSNDEQTKSVVEKWKKTVGKMLAKLLGLADGEYSRRSQLLFSRKLRVQWVQF